MASAADQNVSDGASSLGRSSSIDARDGALPRSDSQRRSANKVGRKGGRSGNDLFVCFAPRTTLNLVSANRPVVSPARDKGKETGSARRSSRGASIFSSKAPSKKQGYDAVEEPTSPKVTCIGQVRSKSKHDKKLKGSPAAPRKQRSSAHAEGKKESACPSFAKDFSCFGLPCDSYGSLPSFRGDKKSSGTVFAKSLVLIQREDEGKMVAMEASATAKLRVQSFPEASSGGEVSAIGKPGLKEEEIHAEMLPVPQKTISVMGVPGSNSKVEALQGKEIAEDQTSIEEDDTFEAEPPPANALLLMRSKVEHLRVLVPPPSINITLKRSTSAPVHCRRKSEDVDDNSQLQPSDYTDHTTAMDAKRETSSVLISSEDLPKPSNVTKSFLQRCKSVSRSLSRSSSDRAEDTKASPATQEVKVVAGGPTACVENSILEEHNDELHLVSEALSRRRSDSEALKVSLDIVPETWVWEARAVTRKEQKEKTGSGRRLEMKQAGGPVAEWLDGELEAALWKSCQVGDSERPPPINGAFTRNDILRSTEPSLTDSCANQALDAEVEATLWRCCSLVASHSSQDLQSELKTGPEVAESDSKVDGSCMESVTQCSIQEEKIEENVKQATNKDEKASHQGSNAGHSNSNNFGRSSSVGSQCGKHLLERGSSLRRSASVGAGRQQVEQQERARNERRKSKERKLHKQSPRGITGEGHVQIDVATSDRYATTCIVEAELWCAGRHSNGHSDKDTRHNDGSCLSDAEYKDASAEVQNASEEEAMDAEHTAVPSPSSVLNRPVPPPSPAPATPPEAVLFVRYDIGAFRISLDGPAKMEAQAAEHHHQQQKAMLEAISHLHIHDVQRTYARLLKAASGKERASLSSAAFRLQRCKSEPVRLASY
ncbi:hypothetical protein GOP47_0013052 [Adiantum capillus-veneris]|uniref:Uncharacterized protein n=1 Tax=Adiantum capillus-veneris TaxID=13818 RepID=A0A9D4USD9_ADICA|nr:hypothetical protein GOP47_0013052 [Adiantum capillus-veneris]